MQQQCLLFFYDFFLLVDGKSFETPKKITSTSKRCVKHLFAGGNTNFLTKSLLFLCLDWDRAFYNLTVSFVDKLLKSELAAKIC